MRATILIALALLWVAVPMAAEKPQAVRVCEPATELPEHRRASFSKTPSPPPQFTRCWYQAPDQGAHVPASVAVGPGMEVDPYSVWRNRFRASHGRVLWPGRGLHGGLRGYHGVVPLHRGFHGARGHRPPRFW